MAEAEAVQFEVSDRYSATGTPQPNRWTVCGGECEGMGFYPTDDPSEWPPGTRLPGEDEEDGTPDDGWRFIKCPQCRGTGRRVNGRWGDVLDYLWTWWNTLHWPLWAITHDFEDIPLWESVLAFPGRVLWMHRQQSVQRQLLAYRRRRRRR